MLFLPRSLPHLVGCFSLIHMSACALLGADQTPSPPREAGVDAHADASDAMADVLQGANDAASPADPGARCGVNGTNACGPFMVCDATLGCVECAADRDCPLTDRFCVQGACVACRSASVEVDAGATSPDNGCSEPSTTCWPARPSCEVRCSADASCPSDAPFCDGPSGQCWACRDGHDCAGGVCSPITRRCVECIDDGSCPTRLPRCHRLRGACVECASNADCGLAAPICDPATRECRVGCISDAQCPGARCDTMLAKCVVVAIDAGLAPSDASDQ